ncbi:MAG: NAD-glutamate dehydrogenase domain-containing protein, partial [Verrucomicrobiota bacterium]
SKVDLLWNGGIGTFAKASQETHDDAGDRNNDALRVDARELQCRVIGEGGNLGFTQLARVEFCLHGGSCNTDFIDNSAGVDCSDHEVNLKIPLNRMIAEGSMTRENRNELLSGMTDAVGALVLHNNYRQTRAISIAQAQSAKRTVEYIRLLEHWERDSAIDRKLEGLPDNEALAERVSRGQALTRPELSVLIAYNKSMLKQELVESGVPDEPFMSRLAENAFPAQFVDQFREQLGQHQLRREIVATQWANDMVNLMGPSFTYRLEESTGATSAEITQAYAAAREIFSLNDLWGRIESLDFQVNPKIQHQMMYELGRLVRRGSRWLVRNCREDLADLPALVKRFRPGVQQIAYSIHSLLHDAALKNWEENFHQFTEAGVPEDLASTISASSGLYSSFGVIFAAEQTGEPVDDAAHVYYSASDLLDLHWLSYRIRDLGVEDHWQARARESFRDELHIQQRQLTINILREFPQGSAEDPVLKWGQPRNHYVDRWKIVLEEFRAGGSRNYAMFPVVLRELAVLVDTNLDS